MSIFSIEKRLRKLEEIAKELTKPLVPCVLQSKPEIIGEVYYSDPYNDHYWVKFTKNDLVDKVDDYYKIGYEPEFCPRWFDKKDVIIYDEINPLNKAIEKIKKERESNEKSK